jgi:hypothetical protein
MKRLRIILIILLIFILAILGAWMYSRNKATKNGATPPTFRQFIGIGTSTKTQKPSTPVDTGSSSFTSPDGITTSSSGTKQSIPIKTSIFTNGGLTPVGSTPPDVIIGPGGGTGSGGSGGSGSGGSGTGGSGGSGGSGSGGSGTGGSGIVTAPQCSDEDTTITFTPDEINRLNALKNRFFAIAETLHTDADVATEASNYDTFKAKEAKITELYNYCINSQVFTSAQATVVASQPYGTVVPGTNGPINYRVPTPFWRDPTKDNQAFINQGSNWQGIFSDPDSIFPERSLEHALRINLW